MGHLHAQVRSSDGEVWGFEEVTFPSDLIEVPAVDASRAGRAGSWVPRGHRVWSFVPPDGELLPSLYQYRLLRPGVAADSLTAVGTGQGLSLIWAELSRPAPPRRASFAAADALALADKLRMNLV
eukprot:Polyplicarium_translucidae@DN1465_c0_g1_i3.p1